MSFEEVAETPVREPAAGSDTPLRLLKLVAVLWVVEEVREVRKQVQAVVKHEAPSRVAMVDRLSAENPPRRSDGSPSSITRIDETKSGNESLGDGPSGDQCLIGRAGAGTLVWPAPIKQGGTLHPPADTGVDEGYTARTAKKACRTTPLRALWQPRRTSTNDGSAATLADVGRITRGSQAWSHCRPAARAR